MSGNTLLSLGLDLGTSTTQLVLSRLTLQNSAAPFAVPKITIAEKEILYRSAVHFTPLLSDKVIDAAGIRAIVAAEYEKAGISPGDIQTGAVIITGETARKENAREVLHALAGFAGDCVVATAGPDLESVLAAKGAGIPRYSKEHHCKIMHFDVGGGTSNWSVYQRGTLLSTGCLNVGGRLVKVDSATHIVTYLSPVLSPPCPALGQRVTPDDFKALLSSLGAQLQKVIPPDVKNLSFSGGVADCMRGSETDPFAYGDIGILLGRALKERFTNAGYALIEGDETIRATVVGAGAHSAELSGSTVFFRDVPFPLKSLPVLALGAEETQTVPSLLAALREKLPLFGDEDGASQVAVALEGEYSPHYGRVETLAKGLALGLEGSSFFPVILVEQDMAKALGQAMHPLVPHGRLLCLDGVCAHTGDYVDVLAPAYGGAVLPVVVKTLAFEQSS